MLPAAETVGFIGWAGAAPWERLLLLLSRAIASSLSVWGCPAPRFSLPRLPGSRAEDAG